MERRTQFNLWYVLFAVIAVFWLRDLYLTATQVQPIPYSEFERDLPYAALHQLCAAFATIRAYAN